MSYNRNSYWNNPTAGWTGGSIDPYAAVKPIPYYAEYYHNALSGRRLLEQWDMDVTQGSFGPWYRNFRNINTTFFNPTIHQLRRHYIISADNTNAGTSIMVLSPKNITCKLPTTIYAQRAYTLKPGNPDVYPFLNEYNYFQHGYTWPQMTVAITEPATGNYYRAFRSVTSPEIVNWLNIQTNAGNSAIKHRVGYDIHVDCRVQIQADGKVRYSYWNEASYTTVDPIFTEGNQLLVTLTYVCPENYLVGLGWFGLETEVFSGSSTEFWTNSKGYDNIESFPGLAMSGVFIGNCMGWPRYATTDPVTPWPSTAEQVWCSKGCAPYNSLRHTISGEYSRHGFLIDPVNESSFSMVTLDMETSPKADCKPDEDEFIQSINPSTPGSYSMYALKPSDDSVFGEGSLKTDFMSFNYVTDRAEHDLSADGAYINLIGPMSFIQFGLPGIIPWEPYNYNSSTEWAPLDPPEYWVPEPGWTTYTSDENSVDIGLGAGFDGFDMFAKTSRASSFAFGATKTVIDNLCLIPAVIKVGDHHFAYLELAENGSVYDRTIRLYEYNFTTDLISVVQSISFGTTSRPCTIPHSSCMLEFVASHGSNDGRLYVGDPEYTGSKTNQGRVVVYDFVESTSTLTYQTELTQTARDTFEGSCICWSGLTSDTIFVGAEDDIEGYSHSGGVYGAGTNFSGPKNSLIGRAFSAGTIRLVAWDVDAVSPKLYSISGTSLSYISQLTGYTYPCDTAMLNEPTQQSGGGRSPKLTTHNNGGHFITNYFNGTTTIPWTSSSAGCSRDMGLSQEYSGRVYLKMQMYLAYTDGATFFGTEGYQNVLADYFSVPEIPYNYNCQTMLMYDGVEERLVHVYESLNRLNSYYHTSEIGTSIQDHTDIGEWWISSSIVSVSTGFDITVASATYTIPDSSCTITFGWRADDSGDYYTPNGSGGFNQYSTLELLQASAASITLFASGVPPFDISNVDEMTFYFFLGKTEDANNPITTPQMSSISMSIDTPGLPNPIICNHFSSNEEIKEIYKTISDVLVVKTPSPPQAGGVQLITSGSYVRPLFT